MKNSYTLHYKPSQFWFEIDVIGKDRDYDAIAIPVFDPNDPNEIVAWDHNMDVWDYNDEELLTEFFAQYGRAVEAYDE